MVNNFVSFDVKAIIDCIIAHKINNGTGPQSGVSSESSWSLLISKISHHILKDSYANVSYNNLIVNPSYNRSAWI